MKRTSFVCFILLLSFFFYQNCSGPNDPSPFQLASEDPDATGTSISGSRLDPPNGAFDISIYESMISVGGNCETVKSKSHYIEVKMQDASNQFIPLQGTPCPECYRLTTARCEHGHYYLVVPVQCAAYRQQGASLYRLTGQLVTIDDKGQETRDKKASFDRFFQVAWAPGICN